MERIVSAWTLAGGALVLAIVAVTMANVAAYTAAAVGWSVPGVRGYEEVVRLFSGAAVLMLLPYCQLMRGHVAVDLFVGMTPAGVQRALDRLSLLLMAALALFLAYWLAMGALESRADGQVSSLLGWSEWPFQLPGVLSLLLWAAVAIAQLFEREGHAVGESGGREAVRPTADG